MYDMAFIPSDNDIKEMENNLRTMPKRSVHFIEWDRLDDTKRERILKWLNTPTKDRAKQAFRLLLRIEDHKETIEAIGVSSNTANRYLKDVRDYFKMILSDEPFEYICSVCAKELGGQLSMEHKFKLHNGTCERCRKHSALIPVNDYGLNNKGEKL